MPVFDGTFNDLKSNSWFGYFMFFSIYDTLFLSFLVLLSIFSGDQVISGVPNSADKIPHTTLKVSVSRLKTQYETQFLPIDYMFV